MNPGGNIQCCPVLGTEVLVKRESPSPDSSDCRFWALQSYWNENPCAQTEDCESHTQIHIGIASTGSARGTRR